METEEIGQQQGQLTRDYILKKYADSSVLQLRFNWSLVQYLYRNLPYKSQ